MRQKRQNRRVVLQGAAASAALTFFSSRGRAQDAANSNLKPVRIAYAALGGGSAPVWAAQEAGIFARNGLRADVSMIRGSTAVTDALIAGTAQFGNIASPGPIKATLQGQGELVYLTGGLNYMVQTLVASPDIATPAQLKGKVFGKASSNSELDDLVLDYVCSRIGIDPRKDLTFVKIKDQPDAVAKLQRNEIQAVLLTPPWLFVATQKGFKILVDALDLKLDYQLGGIVTTSKQVASDPDLARRVVKSYVEGVHYFRRNPDFVVALLKKYSGIEDRDVAMQTWQQYAKFFTPKPYPSDKGIKTVLTHMAHEVPQAAAADPERFIDRRWLDELVNSGFIDDLYKREPG